MVGWRKWTRYGSPAALCAATALAMAIIRTNAGVPSCIRVPPEAGNAISGSRSAVARSTARSNRAAVAVPIEPARKVNSLSSTATRCPPIRPSPVSAASSAPLRARARARSSAYEAPSSVYRGGSSQLRNESASSTWPAKTRAAGTTGVAVASSTGPSLQTRPTPGQPPT